MTLFPIMLEVEETAVGTVLRHLKDMAGIAKLHLDLDNVAKKKGAPRTAPPNPKQAKEAKTEHRPRAKDVLIAALMSGPQTADQLRHAIAKHHFNISSMYPTIGELKAKGVVEMVTPGTYQLTAAALAQLDKPEPSQLAPPVRNGAEVKRQPMGAGQAFIVKVIRETTETTDGIITRTQLVEICTAAGMTERAVDGTITRMKQAKLISTPEPAHYKLTAKAAKKFPLGESAQTNAQG